MLKQITSIVAIHAQIMQQARLRFEACYWHTNLP